MNQKEIAEIRKLFTKENSVLDRICGCYVDANKQRLLEFREAFLSLPEEELYKYLDIFHKGLSGTLGKNLLNQSFSLDTEMQTEGPHSLLMQLRDSGLKDDDSISSLYEKVIASYDCPDNYLILLVHGMYDIPGRTKDGIAMDDASEYVYSFVICCLCPVVLDKAALCYDAEAERITNRTRSWLVGMPQQSFLFPAFNDRNTDIHSLLYYTKDPEGISSGIMCDILGCEQPATAGEVKGSFQALVESTLGDACSFEAVRDVTESLTELVETAKNEPDPAVLDKASLRHILTDSGAPLETLSEFDDSYEEAIGVRTSVPVKNLINTSQLEVKTPDVVVKVKADRQELVETRVIDGRPCLVIALSDDVEVNGIHIVMPGTKGSRAAAPDTETSEAGEE